MSKYVLVPDSFKGTMTSREICEIMQHAIERIDSDAKIISVPVADGGEGTVDAFLSALGGKRKTVAATGPHFEKLSSSYGITDDGTAVIEMSACAGLPLVHGNKNPEITTTYGVGELICNAARSGARRIVIGLGGIATNDGGCGAAAAAGIKFYDKSGKSFIPVGRTLKDIASIDYSGLDSALSGVSISAMCDVDNPLLGETGAANVFGPQKGANVAMIARLDAGLKQLAEVSGKAKLASMPSAGAAGGMGFGMMAFFNCPLQMGIDGLLDIIDFESILAGADLVLTGEGRIDPQSMRGKTVIGVARRASKCGVPTIAVVGDIADGIESAYDLGVSAIFSINRVAMERKLIKLRAKSDMEATVENIIRAVKAVKL